MRRVATTLVMLLLFTGLLHGQTITDLTGMVRCGNGQGSAPAVKLGDKDMLLTAAHVVSRGDEASVTFPNGKTIRVKVVGRDTSIDLAVLEPVDPLPVKTTVLAATAPKRGDEIWTIGYPEGRGPVAKKGQCLENSAGLKDGMMVTQEVIPGDSGGGMFNANGELVGIITVRARDDRGMRWSGGVPLEDIRKATSGNVTCPGGQCRPFPYLGPPQQPYAQPYPYQPYPQPQPQPPKPQTPPPNVPAPMQPLPQQPSPDMAILLDRLDKLQIKIEQMKPIPGPAGKDGAPGTAGPSGANGKDGERGPAGPAGSAGVSGARGATGPAGETGPAGPKGQDGKDGERGVAGPPGKDCDCETLKKRIEAIEKAMEAGIRIQVSPKQ